MPPEAMIAHGFMLTRTETGQVEGIGLLCPEARYASVCRRTANRLERHFVLADQWPKVIQDLAIGWARDVVPASAVTMAALLTPDLRGAFTVRRATHLPVEVSDPAKT